MAYSSGSGTKFYYCTTAGPTAATVSQYAALTWVELTGVETIGEFGDSSQSVTFNLLSEGRVRKLKGARDAGDVQVVCAHDPLSSSQAAMKGFAATSYNYAFKVLTADGADANDTDSVFYFTGKVMSAPFNPGDANTPARRTFNIAIDTEVLEDLGDAVA
ncbi:phage tail tube protein [Phenylobacterium sp. VNQ135]|uniref:phage tail tube protein n=1 Tax=Phenylobacterium sp. VNQ135 TaxID=3400922 RepID=UPI003C022280